MFNIRTVTVLLLFSPIVATAQLTKANYLLGGNMSFATEKHSEANEVNFGVNLSPNAGYFFIDKLAAGIKTAFEFNSSDGNNHSSFIAGPFIRYYFLPNERKINLLVEANAAWGIEKYTGFSTENKHRIGIETGPVIFLNKTIAIEALLGWRHTKYANDSGRYSSIRGSVGVQIYLPNKKADK